MRLHLTDTVELLKNKDEEEISKYRENDGLYTREQWKIIAKFSSETTVLRRQKIIYSRRKLITQKFTYSRKVLLQNEGEITMFLKTYSLSTVNKKIQWKFWLKANNPRLGWMYWKRIDYSE